MDARLHSLYLVDSKLLDHPQFNKELANMIRLRDHTDLKVVPIVEAKVSV